MSTARDRHINGRERGRLIAGADIVDGARVVECFLHLGPVYSRDRKTLRGLRAQWIARRTSCVMYSSKIVPSPAAAVLLARKFAKGKSWLIDTTQPAVREIQERYFADRMAWLDALFLLSDGSIASESDSKDDVGAEQKRDLLNDGLMRVSELGGKPPGLGFTTYQLTDKGIRAIRDWQATP